MKHENNNSDTCPCCERRCSVDNLHCARGQTHFGQEIKHSGHSDRHGGSIKDETVMLMLKCGHMLHHGLRERAESEDILQFLSADEKQTLTTLLQKCAEAWEN